MHPGCDFRGQGQMNLWKRLRIRHGSSFRSGEERRTMASTVVLQRDAQNVRERFHPVSGLLTALTAIVHTPAQLYLARFLLGAAEAGFFQVSSFI